MCSLPLTPAHHSCTAPLFRLSCRWLRPYSNGALPLLDIRSKLVDLLQLMNLDTSNTYTREKLEQSELGKIIMFYEKNPHDKSSRSQGCSCTLAAACAEPTQLQKPALAGSSVLTLEQCHNVLSAAAVWRPGIYGGWSGGGYAQLVTSTMLLT